MVWDLNEETIKPRSPFNIHSEINYPILDDHYRNIIQFPGSFKFIEEINNSIIINDQYLVKSERYYISTAKFNHMRIQILPLALQNISTFRAKF